MTDKQLELREYLSFSRGDRVSFYFKNGTVMTGVVLTKAEIKSDPTTGQYYELIIQVDEYSAKIDSRHVERIWKDPKVYFEENNNIMGKNWICEEYGIDKNLEDQEFVDQLLERWNSYTLGSGLSAKVSIKVNAKPKPPKPQPKPQPAKTGGDGIPRVGDVVTFTGSYYNDSWGMAPKGSRFSGQPGAVVIDSYTAREYGGNGRTTGDFKIHIKSAHDPNYSDLGWVRLSQISSYEKGTDRIYGDQLVWTNENKDTKHHGVSELIYRKKDGAFLTPVQDGDSILPADFVSNLAALSAIDPREFGMNVSTTPNLVQTNIPQNISNVGNVTYHYDALLNIENVEGNLDKSAIPDIQKLLKQSCKYTCDTLADQYQKLGHKIIM